ncbi:MAG: tyrosine-type recombinase/integrase [Acidimicrobiales bacterium]
MARKRANYEGSIYRREDRGRWEASITVGHRADGKPIRRTFTGRTRTIVAGRLKEARQALELGLAMPDNRTTVTEWSKWWLTEVLPGEGLAPKTERWYRDIAEHYVVPNVGTKTLTGPRALTPADIEALYVALERDGRTWRTQDGARTTLSKMLRAAEVRGLVGRNVARLAKAPRDRGRVRKVKAHTVAEVQELLHALEGDRWHPVALVGATTGLRPGELLALHWPDISLGTEPHVSVRHALTYVDGISLKAPKRERSYRTVPLVPEAVSALKVWRRTQAAEQLVAGSLWSTAWPGLVFTTEAGGPRRVDSYGKALTRALPGSSPHRLRHTYATHLLEAGTPIHHVAELLGDTVATVEGTYSHVLRAKHEVVDVARGLLGGAG